jgi:hypothetical protein
MLPRGHLRMFLDLETALPLVVWLRSEQMQHVVLSRTNRREPRASEVYPDLREKKRYRYQP